MNRLRYRIISAALSGVLLGAAFPPVPAGITALFGFVPFFLLFESIDRYGTALRYSYLTFFIFNLITLYWAGGFAFMKDLYQMVAGILLLLIHPFFFSFPVLVWIFIRRKFGFIISLFVFPFLWTGFEYVHSVTEVSFPWLALGNTQTYDVYVIQMAEFTGVQGISFWILCLNVLIFFLLAKTALGVWKPLSAPSCLLGILILFVYLSPKFYGTILLKDRPFIAEGNVRVSLIQPNIDPFEKWTGNRAKPLEILRRQTIETGDQKADLIIWPETAVPFYLLHTSNRNFYETVKSEVDSLGINLLTGIPDVHYYGTDEIVPKSSKISADGRAYDSFNSSVLLEPNRERLQKYAKIILVPFAERVPFSEELSFLNAMEWNFGLGGWARGRDTTVFHCTGQNAGEFRFSNMVCYESIYPGLVSEFVRKGAGFLTVVTNDSWWGNTSGAYQHKQYAVIRAVENRRWILQCANGGISCFIDPYGRTLRQTEMYGKATIHGRVEPRSDLTFFTRFGNWISLLSLAVGAFFVTAGIGKSYYSSIRRRQSDGMY